MVILFRVAVSRGDLEQMTWTCGELILTYLSKASFHSAKRYLQIFCELRSLWGPPLILEEKPEAAKGSDSLLPWATSQRIQSLSVEMEDAVFWLSRLGKEFIRNGSETDAIRAYECSLLLSKSRLGVRYVEELDIADDLAVLYLRRGNFKKALRTFEEGASIDGGRSKVIEFCASLERPAPKVLNAFLRKPLKLEGHFNCDPWANVNV